MPDMTHAYEWRGRVVIGPSGEKIGTIEDVYLDRATDEPEWALVRTVDRGSAFVPLAGAAPRGEHVAINVERTQVETAPSVRAGDDLSPEEEIELSRHYGIEHASEGTVTGTESGLADQVSPPPASAGRARGDDAMTRSEEELRVGKAPRERGRGRLRKYVVTEQIDMKVPVRREELRVEREPITEADLDEAGSPPTLSEEEHEVVLHEEEVVAEKRVVPKERVRLEKETVTEEVQVSEEVHKERIDVEGERPTDVP